MERKKKAVLKTKTKVDKNHMVDVLSEFPNNLIVLKPEIIADYMKNMGGVNCGDHFIGNYQFIRKSKKWYRKIVFWFRCCHGRIIHIVQDGGRTKQ